MIHLQHAHQDLFLTPQIAASLITTMSSSLCTIPPSSIPSTLRLFVPDSLPSPVWSHAVLCVVCNHLLGFMFTVHKTSDLPEPSSSVAAAAHADAINVTSLNESESAEGAVSCLTIDPAPGVAVPAIPISSSIVTLRSEAISFLSPTTQRYIDFCTLASSHRRLISSSSTSSVPSRCSIFGTSPPPPPIDPSLSNIM